MTGLGQVMLLAAFVTAGYAAFALCVGRYRDHAFVSRSGLWSAWVAVAALTGTLLILAYALVTKDFRFDYVARYSSQRLSWHYSLSALWVGQAGSLLLWTWVLGVMAVLFRLTWRHADVALRDIALGVLLGYTAFMIAIMVFAADPMKASLAAPAEGDGLSPLLQHPAMLIHPPIVFTAYAGWTIPFALCMAALALGRLDATWCHEARRWALFSWVVLGIGILLGANWAYEELGWGGYWAWDPVENGSLLPWLTGTALIHCLMVWRHLGALKKTAIALAIATFGLCNFATFLTRSGIFSSLHAFSQSPIGWLFLGLMLVLVAAGALGIGWWRMALRADRPISHLASREAMVVLSAALLSVFSVVVMVGTIWQPLSRYLLETEVTVGPEFYNLAVLPVVLVVLAATSVVPLLRWGGPPSLQQIRALAMGGVLSLVAVGVAFAAGLRHPLALAIAGLASLAVLTLVQALALDCRRRSPQRPWSALAATLRAQRRPYAGYVIHLGFFGLVIGVTGSSLGTQRYDATLREGDTVQWAGRTIEYLRLIQRELPDKLVAEAELKVTSGRRPPVLLYPARHYFFLQQEWTTEVAIDATWRGDFYTILHSGEGEGVITLTLVDNPLLQWIWWGGGIMACGALFSLAPAPRARRRLPAETPVTGAGSVRRDRSSVEVARR